MAAFLLAGPDPSRALGLFATTAIALLVVVIAAEGPLALWAIIAIGLFNSILWSNIFTLAIAGLGADTAQGSSLLVMMIFGGALIPLGQGAIIGSMVPDVQHMFRLRLGAMSLAEFERYLPGGVRFLQVRDWVRNYLGVELAWDAQVVLKRDEVPAARLGSYGQLGWTSWLGMPPGKRSADADDVLLDMERLTNARLS